MAPSAIKTQAIFLFRAKPGFLVTLRKIPKANITADTNIPNIIELSNG